ncbi:MAG: thioesterase family protein [Treponema sp.]
MPQVIELEVRSYELDSYNHVNNAVYLNYLEYARMEFLKRIGFDYKGLIADGYMLYVTHIDIRYKYSARLHDKLNIEVSSLKLGKLSGTFRQIIKNSDGLICAEAEVSWGCVDTTGKPSKIPEQYLVPGLIPETEKQ